MQLDEQSVRKMPAKYEFIQILMILRDKMNCKEDAEIIQNMISDLMETDQCLVKEKYGLL